MCPSIRDGDSIGIFHNGDWKDKKVEVVGLGEKNRVDTGVAVLALENQLSPSFSLPATSAGLVWAQNIYFLGYPYGLHTSVDMNEGYRVALVKGALFSGEVEFDRQFPHKPFSPADAEGIHETFLLDGHNNPGFSGGPVVFRPAQGVNAELCVMGVVSGFRSEDVDVKLQNKPTGLISKANTGIVVCPSIKRATDMIAANPIGAQVVS